MWVYLTILFAVVAVVVQVVWMRRHRRLGQLVGRLRREKETIEAALHDQRGEADHRQSALFDSMVEGVLIVDARNRILMVNASFRRLFNLDGDVTGKSIMETLRLHELQELVERLPAVGRITEFELQTLLPRSQTLQVNAVGLTGAAGRGSAMLVFHDVSRIKQLENMRKDFVANVSHELRTPLSMIKGYVETLLDGAKESPEITAKFLKTIENHADRLTFLIEDLLTISSLESGQVTMNMQPLELAPLVERVLDELRDRASSRSIGVVADITPDLTVTVDGGRIQQVLFNLIDNGIKYGRAGGRIVVAARATGQGAVEVSVADDGPGIPAEAAERVFERFYRVDKARSREQGGTGLGLAIVKHIVQAHGGEVWVDSTPGKGAIFFFTLKPGSLVA
ncbi:MAG TPA: PAS domain-containing sensor histidine kinase [Verrucomicrobiales bacterium]|nr:PAS domain-containing sensor histidine kinase [Verrucomicrobiales bacterium]